MKNLLKKRLIILAVINYFMTSFACSASLLTLPSTPLISSTTTEPNLMLLLDSSVSMANIVKEDVEYEDDYSGAYEQGYNENYTYDCNQSNTWPESKNENERIYIKVDENGNGTPYFSTVQDEIDYYNNYTFGNSNSANPTITTTATTTVTTTTRTSGHKTYTANVVTIVSTTINGKTTETTKTNSYKANSSTTDSVVTTTFGPKCFDNTKTYRALLNANSTSTESPTIKNAESYDGVSYTGHYLNWYFDSTTGGFIDGKKENTSTRMDIVQQVITDAIENVTNIRIGLAQYDMDSVVNDHFVSDGAKILVDLDSITSNEEQRTALTSAVNNIVPYGFAPLGGALQDLGWYFTKDTTDDLTLHDGETYEQSCSPQTIFDYSINHTSDTITSTKDVIQNKCQQNYIIAITKGSTSFDSGISEAIEEYDDESATVGDGITPTHNNVTTNITNAVNLMYETDLKPTFENIINNVTTYFNTFTDSIYDLDYFDDIANSIDEGNAFSNFTNHISLAKNLNQNIATIIASQPLAAMSAVSFNTTELSADSTLFKASFNASNWTSVLKAYELSDSGEISTTSSWDAADKLDALSKVVDADKKDIYDRNIFTYNGSRGIEFITDNYLNLSDIQRNDLMHYSGVDVDGDNSIGGDQDDAKQLMNYLRGDNLHEGNNDNNYRPRSSILGDIVNSTTVYVGAPELTLPEYTENNFFGSYSNSYSNFKTGDAAKRTPIVYVGANDGMLHGFNAQTGEEEMAYIPGLIASSDVEAGMHYLGNKSYEHQFYVDSTPIVSDVFINSQWKTILIGGLRAGGKGIFALDVTDPADYNNLSEKAENLVLWEFTTTDDSDFGYHYTKPIVAMMANGKWAVIVGNGYNSNNSKAALFIIFIEEGVDGIWSIGDYKKIAIDNWSGYSNGLSSPTVVDLDGDSIADRVYAGDLLGKLWVFDVSNEKPEEWGVAYTKNNSSAPLFTADDGSNGLVNPLQPITSAPIVIKNTSSTKGDPNLLVLFGTGKYLEKTDLSDQSLMTYYGVLDAGEGQLTRKDLTERKLLTDNGLRTVVGDSWNGTSGWYFDLVNRVKVDDEAIKVGERVISDSITSDDVLFFNSIIPNNYPCSSGGKSWLMSIDKNTGLAPTDYAIFDANKNGVIEGGDLGYIGEEYTEALVSSSTILENTQYMVDSKGDPVERIINTGKGTTGGRIAWKEILRD